MMDRSVVQERWITDPAKDACSSDQGATFSLETLCIETSHSVLTIRPAPLLEIYLGVHVRGFTVYS